MEDTITTKEQRDKRKAYLRYFDSTSEVIETIQTQSTNPHIAFLLETLGSEEKPLASIFAYGAQKLPKEEERPDLAIKVYFYIVSEIQELPPEMRSFAIDAMVYAENTADFPTETYEDLQERYTQMLFVDDRLQKEIDIIRTLIIDHEEEEALLLLEKVYATYRPLEKIEYGSEQEKTIAWKIIDLRSSLSFKGKYSVGL